MTSWSVFQNQVTYIVNPVNFTCSIKFYVLTITQDIIIFIVVDIYEQEQPTLGEFLNTHMKNSIL